MTSYNKDFIHIDEAYQKMSKGQRIDEAGLLGGIGDALGGVLNGVGAVGQGITGGLSKGIGAIGNSLFGGGDDEKKAAEAAAAAKAKAEADAKAAVAAKGAQMAAEPGSVPPPPAAVPPTTPASVPAPAAPAPATATPAQAAAAQQATQAAASGQISKDELRKMLAEIFGERNARKLAKKPLTTKPADDIDWMDDDDDDDDYYDDEDDGDEEYRKFRGYMDRYNGRRTSSRGYNQFRKWMDRYNGKKPMSKYDRFKSWMDKYNAGQKKPDGAAAAKPVTKPTDTVTMKMPQSYSGAEIKVPSTNGTETASQPANASQPASVAGSTGSSTNGTGAVTLKMPSTDTTKPASATQTADTNKK